MTLDPVVVVTVTLCEPAAVPGRMVKVAISLPGPVATSELTTTPLLEDTEVLGVKFVAVIVTTKEVPAAPDAGEIEVVVGSTAASAVAPEPGEALRSGAQTPTMDPGGDDGGRIAHDRRV